MTNKHIIDSVEMKRMELDTYHRLEVKGARGANMRWAHNELMAFGSAKRVIYLENLKSISKK